MKNIAIFASGSGSNAQKIIAHFNTKKSLVGQVVLVVCNKENAGVLQIAAAAQVPSAVLTRTQLNNEDYMQALLQKHHIDFIVLAGFLLLIPEFLTRYFHHKIVNIHPALLPKYGGKGMYGKNVHQAVWQNRESQTGITIHFANEHYDEGNIVFQASTEITAADTPETIAQKVQQLEHQHFPAVIEKLLKG